MDTEGALMVREQQPLTVAQVKANVDRILQVMQGVMKKGVDYGQIPGCGDKPTLLKPGAEKINMTFKIGVDPEIQNLSTDDEAHFIIKARMFHEPTGIELGKGIGECSSYEEKYKWRKAVCEEEFNETPEDRRRLAWKPEWQNGHKTGKFIQVKQVRTNKADVSNTVLKMAKKRANVDGTLTVTAASAIFNQDLDEMEEEIRSAVIEGEVEQDNPASKPIEPPKAKAAPKAEPNKEGYAFVPQAISKKEGQGSKGPWVKFGIKDEQGAWFGTFDEELGALAEQAKKENRQVEITYENDGKYNNIKTLALA